MEDQTTAQRRGKSQKEEDRKEDEVSDRYEYRYAGSRISVCESLKRV